jgi:ferredoxin-type protein NapH
MITLARRIVQVLTLLLLAIIPFLSKKGFTFVTGSLYSLSIGPVWITDPLIGVQTVLTTMTLDKVLLLSLAVPVVGTLVLGRVFCGWVCPQNTLSEFVDHAAETAGFKRPVVRTPSAGPRYAVLTIIFALLLVTGIPLASLLSAPGIISVQIAQFVTEEIVGLELMLIGIIIVVELFLVRRAWCNYVCPVGSFLGLLRFKRTLKVVLAEDADHVCINCMACSRSCRLGLDPLKGSLYPQCHNCGACIDACDRMRQEKRPLAFKF